MRRVERRALVEEDFGQRREFRVGQKAFALRRLDFEREGALGGDSLRRIGRTVKVDGGLGALRGFGGLNGGKTGGKGGAFLFEFG